MIESAELRNSFSYPQTNIKESARQWMDIARLRNSLPPLSEALLSPTRRGRFPSDLHVLDQILLERAETPDDTDDYCKRCGESPLEHMRVGMHLCNTCTEHVDSIKDGPGTYIVVDEGGLWMLSGPLKTNKSEIRNDMQAKPGDVIFVKEIFDARQDGRIRGRVEYPYPGWISLVNKGEGVSEVFRKCWPLQEVLLLLDLGLPGGVHPSSQVCTKCNQPLRCLGDASGLDDVVTEGLKAALIKGRKKLTLDYREHSSCSDRVLLEIRGPAVTEVKQKIDAFQSALKKQDYDLQMIENHVFDAPYRIFSQKLGVWAVILVQFVLYMCVNSQQPALYNKMSQLFNQNAAATYSWALTCANVVKLCAPVLFGFISQRRNAKWAYLFTMFLGAAAALTLCTTQTPLIMGLAWGVLQEGPPAIRCVRYIYMAQKCTSSDLGRLSQHATTIGLLGGGVGNLLAGFLAETLGPESVHGWPGEFSAASIVSIFVFGVTGLGLSFVMNSPKVKMGKSWTNVAIDRVMCDFPECNRSAIDSSGLCSHHSRNYALDKSFDEYKIFITVIFSMIQAMLEFGVNAVVITTFQPIVVKHFGWGTAPISLVMLSSSILSFTVSHAVSNMNMRPLKQSAVAAGFYTASVLLFTVPPLSQWRVVVALIFGLKAQILFSSPFSALYAEKIGKKRLTQTLGTAFQLAPGIGGMLGAACAPIFLPLAGQAAFMLPSLPVFCSLGLIYYFRDHFHDFNQQA